MPLRGTSQVAYAVPTEPFSVEERFVRPRPPRHLFILREKEDVVFQIWFKSTAGRRTAVLLSFAAILGVLLFPTTSGASPSCSGTPQLRAALVVDTGRA